MKNVSVFANVLRSQNHLVNFNRITCPFYTIIPLLTTSTKSLEVEPDIVQRVMLPIKCFKDLFRNEKKFIEQMTGNRDKIWLNKDQKRTILKKQNNRCRHCRKKCSFEKDDLVVDHSHYTGQIHGISHNLWWGSFLNFFAFYKNTFFHSNIIQKFLVFVKSFERDSISWKV